MNSAITAVFLDRDGTLIADKHYLSDPDGVELLPGVVEGLSTLAWAGARLFMVSNQSGIGRGLFGIREYEKCHARLEELLQEKNLTLTDALHCPHGPDEACGCRKPATGMWETLRDRHGLEASQAAMVGDKEADVLFGRNAGFALSVLVLTGKGKAEAERLGLPELPLDSPFLFLDDPGPGEPHIIARDLESAAAALLMGSSLEGAAESLMAELDLPENDF